MLRPAGGPPASLHEGEATARAALAKALAALTPDLTPAHISCICNEAALLPGPPLRGSVVPGALGSRRSTVVVDGPGGGLGGGGWWDRHPHRIPRGCLRMVSTHGCAVAGSTASQVCFSTAASLTVVGAHKGAALPPFHHKILICAPMVQESSSTPHPGAPEFGTEYRQGIPSKTTSPPQTEGTLPNNTSPFGSPTLATT